MTMVAEETRSRLTPLRRITITNLETSARTAVPVTLHESARAEPLLQATAAHASANPDVRVTVTAMLAHVLARVTAAHPAINASIDGEELVTHGAVNLGLAVALASGDLMLPVLRAAERLTVAETAAEVARLTERARAMKLGQADVGGAVVALSSVGRAMPGVSGIPALPAGATAVLLVGAPVAEAVVVDGQVVAQDRLRLSLTVDHRVANGMQILAFLQDLVAAIENPGDLAT